MFQNSQAYQSQEIKLQANPISPARLLKEVIMAGQLHLNLSNEFFFFFFSSKTQIQELSGDKNPSNIFFLQDVE